MTTLTKTSATPKTTAAAEDAIALLMADHEAVSGLFAHYEKTRSETKRKALVADICTALSVHAQIEEEIFYPAVKAALKDKLLVPEATIEHGSIKDLIAQLEGLKPGGEMYDAKVQVLSEYVKHHVTEEQCAHPEGREARDAPRRPALHGSPGVEPPDGPCPEDRHPAVHPVARRRGDRVTWRAVAGCGMPEAA